MKVKDEVKSAGYRIGAGAKLAGISPDTLRVWERVTAALFLSVPLVMGVYTVPMTLSRLPSLRRSRPKIYRFSNVAAVFSNQAHLANIINCYKLNCGRDIHRIYHGDEYPVMRCVAGRLTVEAVYFDTLSCFAS